MTLDRIALDHAIDAFLEIPFHEQGWAPALERFDAAVGALGTVILPALTEKMPGPFPVSPSMVACTGQYVEENWIREDVRQRALPVFLSRGIATDRDCISPDLKQRLPYYQDFIFRNGADEWAGVRTDIGGDICCLSIQRPIGAEPYSRDELRHLVSVAPRISMLTSMLKQIDRARLRGMGEALEAMQTPAFLLNRRSEVIGQNAAGRAVLGRGISIADKKLVTDGPDNRALQQRIAAVLRQSDLASPASGVPLQVRRPGGRPLLVRVQRLRGDATLAYFASAWAIVTATDPDRHLAPVAGVLESMFGLTRREAELVVILVECDGAMRVAAERAGITYETLRTHFKAIRGKTGLRGIAELMGLVSRIGAQLGG